jgi:FkbM family methyltransferase
MDEIFIENSYGINLAQDATVLDIGANIGDSSIYFAQLPFVKKVYCFEPFPITFQQSQFNFNLNAHLKEKIIPYNFGLSNKDKVLDNVNFDIKETGGMTSVESDAPKKGKATIKLKSVVGVFEKICSQTKSKIIVKCDCEGAEYEIFDALDKSGQLKRIDFCLIEYHKGMEPLVEIFLRNGFVLLTKFTTGMGIGYLTAIKIWGNDTTRTKW